MIIIKIIGGLGNQMFQYALARSLEIKTGFNVSLDISGFSEYRTHNYDLEYLNIKKNIYATRNDLKKIKSDNRIFKESHFHFTKDIFEIEDNTYIEGYWQSEKYFKNIEDLIRKEFVFKSLDRDKNLILAEEIQNSNSVSLHVRRGDYISNPNAYKIHGGICDLDYYQQAIDIINNKIDNPIIYCFSDDIKWVKETLKLNQPVRYIDWNKGRNNYIDMQLMSLCKHNIIANSTFSWWGAWLNSNVDKVVICPQKWFNDETKNTIDLIPEGWVKI